MSEAAVKPRAPKRIFNTKIGDYNSGWTVIYGPVYLQKNQMTWLCRCDCGTQRYLPGPRFVENRFFGCGCTEGTSAIDLTGKRFHNFVVVDKTNEMRKRGRIWECKCDCGKYFTARASDIMDSKIHSCGCYASPRRLAHALPIRERFFKPHLKTYKHNAELRNLEWSISNEFFQNIVLKDCFYCGAKPSKVPRWNTTAFDTVDLLVNGIDRIDSNLGYVESNCAPCCSDCNIAKASMTQEYFLSWIKRVATHMNLMPSPQPESYVPATTPQSLLGPTILL